MEKRLTRFAMAYLAPTDLVVNAPAARMTVRSDRFSQARDEFNAGLLGWLFGAHLAGSIWYLIVRQDGVAQAIAPDRLARCGTKIIARTELRRL